MNTSIRNEEYKGYDIDIFPDENAQNPIEDCDWPKGTFFHVGGNLNAHTLLDGEAPDDVGKFLRCMMLNEAEASWMDAFDSSHIWLPVYKYEHGGVMFNTTGFSCPWDSGLTGMISMPIKTALKEWGPGLAEASDKATKCLRSMVDTYSKWCNGEYVGYIIEKDGEEVDDGSCWGFDDQDCAIKEAKSIIDFHVEAE